MDQLTGFTRNTTTRAQSYDYDAVGNFEGQTTNGSTQTRTHNRQNEILTVSGATSPTFDANGNMTKDETGKQYSYDAWNRLKVVKDAGGTTLVSYNYDAENQRVQEVTASTRDLYYSDEWQVLEERVGGVTRVSYVWSPVYVDAMIARDRDADNNGSLEERLYPTHDANFNVSGLVNTTGVIVERYAYDPFGSVTIQNASGTTIAASTVGWQYLHQGGRLNAASGLYSFRNREYSPTLGRWVTMDPIRYEAGDVNLYRYIGNNSLSRLDPNGTNWVGRTFANLAVAFAVNLVNGTFSDAGDAGADAGGVNGSGLNIFRAVNR